MAKKRPGPAGVPFDAITNPSKYAVVVEDFFGAGTTTGAIGQLGWKLTSVAGDSVPAVTVRPAVAGGPGRIDLSTGATTPAAADEGALSLGQLLLNATNATYFAAIIAFPSITSVEFNFGLFATALGAGRDTDSVTIEFDASADAQFQGVTVASSTATVLDLAVTPVITSNFKLEMLAYTTSVDFWIDGNHVGRNTANIPTAQLVPGFKVATEAAAEKKVDLDAFWMWTPVAR